MSKRVEVREGDGWDVYAQELYQIRGKQERAVVFNNKVNALEWRDKYKTVGESLPASAARAWIESLGGEWAEVAEEKKPEAVEVVYLADGVGRVYMSVKGSKDATMLIENCGHRPITIAGVTT